MEIIEIRKHSLHNMEHYQFATQVIKLCEEAGIEKLKTLLKTLKDAVVEEDKALNIPRKKEGTADLEALDPRTRPCLSRTAVVGGDEFALRRH